MSLDSLPVSSPSTCREDASPTRAPQRSDSLISAMKQASRSLVAAMRRAGTRNAFPAIIMAVATLGLSQKVSAATVTAIYSGTVSSGTDTTGVFGAPGAPLDGLSFTLTFTFDDTKGQEFFYSTYSYIQYTDASSPGTAVIAINGRSFSFGTLAGKDGYPSNALRYAPPGAIIDFSAGDGIDGDGSIVVASAHASDNGPLADANWEDAFSSSQLIADTSSYFTIGEDEENEYASGILTVTSVTVSGPQATNPVAKTLGKCMCNGNPNASQAVVPQFLSSTGQPKQGDPIAIGSGNMFEEVTDYTTAGPNPLAFTRYYNSLGNANGIDTYAATLGTNWRSTYDRYLHVSPSLTAAERPDGQVLSFVTIAGGFMFTDTDIDAKLTHAGATWTLTDSNDTVETYSVSGTKGTLTSIKLRDGYTQKLAYSGGLLASVTDSYGRVLKFTYAGGLLETLTTPDTLALTYGITPVTGGNQLTSVAYNTSPVTSQTYSYSNASLPFALTGITDENGNSFESWSYDYLGRATSSQAGNGANLTTVAYDDASGNRTVTNALGVTDTYKFATLQNIPKVTEIDRAATSTTAAATETFAYDSNGYLSRATDWNGNVTTYVNNAHGQPTAISEAVGSKAARTTTISYDPTWVHEPKQIVTPGLTSNFTYDGSGNPLTRTDTDTTTNTAPYSTSGQTRVTAWTWSNTGEETSMQLPRTDTTAKTSFTYDATGTLTQVQDALGHLTKITAHTEGGLPQTIVDPNGVTTTLGYDARLNLHTSTLATTTGKLTTTWTHDAANQLTALQMPDGSKLTYSYDTAHRLTGTSDLFGSSIATTLDALGDPTLMQVTNPSGTVTRNHAATFDALGRMLTDIGGAGQTTTTTYDRNGNPLIMTPSLPSGPVTSSYDALNRPITRKDPSPGGTTTTSYDAHDRALTVTDANGNTTAYTYNGFGDRTQTASPDSGTTVNRYDPDRNLTQMVKPGPLTANMGYDALDRPTTTIYPADSSLNVTRIYDQPTGHGFGIGRLTSATDQVGSLSLTYDERGNATTENRTVTGAGTLSTITAYDKASRVAGIAYPSGTLVAYGRDSMGRVTSVMAQPPGATSGSNVVTGITYEPFGPETAMTFGNGITGTYGYDLDYRPTTRIETGTTPVQNLTYAYYGNDSVQAITDGVNALNSQSLNYDTLDRLTRAASGPGGYGTQSFAWDPVGNVTSENFNGTLANFGFTPGTNQLAQATEGSRAVVTTTPAGNIATVTHGAFGPYYLYQLTYNQANQLATAQTPYTYAAYKYDLGGQRLLKALPGMHPILYQYSRTNGALLSENDLNKGQTADYIYLNGRPIGEVNPTSGQLYYTHTDRLGTPQRLTDATQAIAWNSFYTPFGLNGYTTTGTLATQNLRMPGQQFDAETGLYHNGFRDYAPLLTRYVETDPIGLVGGMNVYQYAAANPLKLSDSSGLDSDDSWGPIDPSPAANLWHSLWNDGFNGTATLGYSAISGNKAGSVDVGFGFSAGGGNGFEVCYVTDRCIGDPDATAGEAFGGGASWSMSTGSFCPGKSKTHSKQLFGMLGVIESLGGSTTLAPDGKLSGLSGGVPKLKVGFGAGTGGSQMSCTTTASCLNLIIQW